MAESFVPTPGPSTEDPKLREVIDWVQRELAALAAQTTNFDTVQQNVLHVAPERPREGLVVVADGTDWNPGNGAGQYTYVGGVWVYNGNIAQDLSGYLTKADNLASVANPATALSNLAGAPLASPAFTGNPTAPTQSPGTNNTRIATTAYADAAVGALSTVGRLVAGISLVLNPYSASASSSQAHGLGVVPAYVDFQWECLSADLEYSAGDVIWGQPGPGLFAFTVLGDATNLTIVRSSQAIRFITKTSFGNTSNATNSKWKLTLTPYKLST